MIETILKFWFDPDNNQQSLYNRAEWWQKNETLDTFITDSFSDIRRQAIQGELNHWLETPKGALAYIILIDQFSRNMLRYAHDGLALKAAKMAVDKQYDTSLPLTYRVFIYMPLEHSESISDQKQCLDLFFSIIKDAPEDAIPMANQLYEYAKEHYDIIKQFNRFPHRNKILSRKSTKNEIKFLETHSGF